MTRRAVDALVLLFAAANAWHLTVAGCRYLSSRYGPRNATGTVRKPPTVRAQ